MQVFARENKLLQPQQHVNEPPGIEEQRPKRKGVLKRVSWKNSVPQKSSYTEKGSILKCIRCGGAIKGVGMGPFHFECVGSIQPWAYYDVQKLLAQAPPSAPPILPASAILKGLSEEN